jgi:hypothetical protein
MTQPSFRGAAGEPGIQNRYRCKSLIRQRLEISGSAAPPRDDGAWRYQSVDKRPYFSSPALAPSFARASARPSFAAI